MEVESTSVAGHSEHEGRTYHFCSLHCKQKFDADPARFVKPGAETAPTRESPNHGALASVARHTQSTPDGVGERVNLPIAGWLLSPIIASAALSLSSVFVVANRLRLRNFRAQRG